MSVAAIMAICINIPFNYLLIFKLNLGISGAAMASSLAEFGAFIVLLLYMWVRVDKVKYGLKVVYDEKVLIKLLRISVWSMLHSFISVAPGFCSSLLSSIWEGQSLLFPILLVVFLPSFCDCQLFCIHYWFISQQSNWGGAGKELFPVCHKVLRLGYAVGVPLIVMTLWGNQWVIGFYTNNDNLVRLAFYPFIVMLLNYAFALPGYVYINAVTGTGKTKLAFIFQLITILVYLIYLYLLSECFHASLTVYMTAEYLFVILLGMQSIIYLKRKSN